MPPAGELGVCGIAAQYKSDDSATGLRMLDRLTHRGPDGQGEVQVAGNWLGHRRLAIVDIDGGAQPLVNQAGDFWLVGNGEVYNHQEVREGFVSSSLSTDSDNEVALHLLDTEHPSSLAQLEGMFSFVAAGSDGRFIAARDPVGIKPLYWARYKGAVRFASEMGAFDSEWLPLVETFPPGHYWTPESGLTRFAHSAPEAYQQSPVAHQSNPPPSVLKRTREALIDCVERQMMGDVPVGVFLSGGLDSNLVAAIAARFLAARNEQLKTFAVGTAGSPDLAAAQAVAKALGTDHYERIYTAQDAVQVLPNVIEVIESFDPSLVRSAVPGYLLSELAAQHVKVVLTGEGADELFAGYEYYHDLADDKLHDELVSTIEGLHNLNLQRCDRMTMAWGLEARVPFLDSALIEFALALPVEWKLADQANPEKRLLREAFAGWLPEKYLWRKKAQFGDGSGAADVLQDHFTASVTEADFTAARDNVDPPLRSLEELAYWRLFSSTLPGIEAEHTIGRFATT